MVRTGARVNTVEREGEGLLVAAITGATAMAMEGAGVTSSIATNTGAFVETISDTGEGYGAGEIETTSEVAIEVVLPVPDRDQLKVGETVIVGDSDADMDGAGDREGAVDG
jgi:hypothetical protein